MQTLNPTAELMPPAPRLGATALRFRFIARKVPRSQRGHRLAFVLLVMAAFVLFIRPSEIVPALEGLPLYETLVALCCVVSLPILFDQTFNRLSTRPLNVCVFGLFLAVVMSHLSHFFIWGARHSAVTFGKLAVVYLLIAGVLDTPARLKKFLGFLGLYIVALTVMSLLEYFHVIDLPQLAAYAERVVLGGSDGTSDVIVIDRLRSSGIFNDPNDLCLILLFGLMLCLYFANECKQRLARWACLLCAPMFVWAIYLTHSRGGFMALVSSIGMVAVSKFGWKRAIVPMVVLTPILLWVFAGRQTDLNTAEGTAQARVHLWSESLTRFRHAPIFGIGMDQFAEEVGMVVHNSFLQCFVELGFFGGMLFLGSFAYSAYALRRLGQYSAPGIDPGLVRLRPYLLGSLVAYAVGFMSLSRSYSMPTYLLFGLFTSYLGMATPAGLRMPRMGLRLLTTFAAISVVLIGMMYVFIRLAGRWG